MPDFNVYQAPGVFLEEEQTPLVAVVGVQPVVVAIVGPALGYLTFTETVTLTGTTPMDLTQEGIDIVNGFAVTLSDGTPVDPGDYDLAQTGSGMTATTTIARSSGSSLDDPVTVTVAYRYADANYFSPLRARNFDDVKSAFGEPFDLGTGEILSPLSLGAKVALENGATSLVLVPTESAADAVTRTELSDAYDKLSTFDDIKIIVPLPVGITGTDLSLGDTRNIGSDLKEQVETLSDAGVRCIGIIGWDKDADISPDLAVATFASSRVMAAWPNRMSYFNGSNNTTFDVDGVYLAAAYAGLFAANPVETPLTKKIVRGFAGIPTSIAQTMTTAQKNIWSDAGVSVTEPQRDGRLSVRHGTSTDRTNVQTREMSLTRAKDAMMDLIEDTLVAGELIGTFITPDTPTQVQGVVQGALETAKAQSIIVDYNSLTVRQQSIDPSVIEVKFQYLPAYPLNYIVVAFSINTTTGETTPIDNTGG